MNLPRGLPGKRRTHLRISPLALAAVLALGACTAPELPAKTVKASRVECPVCPACPECPVCPEVTESVRETESSGLLAYYRRLTQFSARQLNQEHQRIQGNERTSPLHDSLRLALLLSLPETEFRDEDRARKLLSDYLRANNSGSEGEDAFALLLLDMLKERQRQQQELKTTKEALAEARASHEDLQEQLEKLKRIESYMKNREDSLAVPPIEDNRKNDEAKDPAGR